MAVIRAAVVTVPPLLVDIIKTLLAEHVIVDVVARLDDRKEVEKQLRLSSPDLIIIGLRKGETDAIGRALLELVPVAKVIALSYAGQNAYLHEMRAHRLPLTDVSPRALIEVILEGTTE